MQPPTSQPDNHHTLANITIMLGIATIVMALLACLLATERDTRVIAQTVGLMLAGVAVILMGARERLDSGHGRFLPALRSAYTILFSAAVLILGAVFLYDLWN